MSLPDELTDVLSQHLNQDEIEAFERGETALFISETKYAFFQSTDAGFQRADAVFDHNPEGNKVGEIYNEVHKTDADEVIDRLKDVSEIKPVPAELAFGDFA